MTKPCRWCGSCRAGYVQDGSRIKPAFSLACRECGASGPTVEASTEEKAQRLAIVAWNAGPMGRRIYRVS